MNDNLVQQWREIDGRVRKEILKARKKGMNKAVGKIRNKTKALIKSSLPAAKNHNPKYNDTMLSGAKVSKYKDNDLVGEAIAGAHIMGTRKTGSGSFRLRFFEDGTTSRTTKRGYRRGKVSGKHFFKNAVDSEISKAPSIIERELEKAIERCNNG